MQRVAMEISCAVKPGILDHPSHVDHKRIPVPGTTRPAHPRIDWGLAFHTNIYDARSERKFIVEGHILRRLHNLKRKRHVGGARYPRQVTFDSRIAGEP